MDNLVELKAKFESGDLFPKSLGIEILELSAGYAKVAMTIKDNMLNLHGIGHGGAVYTLADTAFALACNSHGKSALALSVSIDYLAPAKPGERLFAIAEENHKSRKTGNYQIRVINDSGDNIALVRGIAYIKS